MTATQRDSIIPTRPCIISLARIPSWYRNHKCKTYRLRFVSVEPFTTGSNRPKAAFHASELGGISLRSITPTEGVAWMDCLIREAVKADALAISRLIIDTLRESNAQDYSSDVINQVELSFSPQAILRLLTQRKVFVAILKNQIIATAGLDQDVVRSVFVEPAYQGKGIGRQLMTRIQVIALSEGFNLLRVPSSVTAQGFYTSLGFKKIRDVFHQSERTIIMSKRLVR